MNRRTFLKRVGQSIAGVLALPALPLIAKIKKPKVFNKAEIDNKFWPGIGNPVISRKEWNPISNGKKRIGWANTHPIAEGEIGPIECGTTRTWTENGRRTVMVERKTRNGKIVISSDMLPEPAKALHIHFGRIIAFGENATYAENIK